jgi:Domain of unknown function (DUF4167)
MPSKGQTYDSSGPDIRVRGNAYQVLEKYLQLARDAGTMGDRVAAENFLQHADHYYRVVAAMNEGRRPQIGGRDVSVADVNVHNVSQGLSAALSGHGHSNASGDDNAPDPQPGNGPGNGGGNNQGNGSGGNGQNRPQQHQQHASREAHNNAGGQNSEQPPMTSAESANSGETQRAQSDEQPDYPDDALPADQQSAAPNGEGGQPENRQHNRMGRGRRRGPGRRIRGDGDSAPEGSSTPDSDGAQ